MYDEEYYRYRESTRDFRVEAELLYELLRPEPDSGILEVGCGGGAFLAFLEGKGHCAVGVDLLEEAVRLAERAAPRSTILCADALRLPFPDAHFDRLVSHHLVEHLEDLRGALLEWKRVLRPGGIMVVCTPNRVYPSPRIFEDPGHVRLYDRAELEEAVRGCGFRVTASFTVFPHLLRDRVSVAVGVPLYRLFRRLPWFRERGRSLFLSAVKE
ncbi:MAG: class I SAM-dependent methyltransferase [Actinomycetota bacterium]|nr:class I SAM-dependent methyltransferase [Actinomycetota bacterium]